VTIVSSELVAGNYDRIEGNAAAFVAEPFCQPTNLQRAKRLGLLAFPGGSSPPRQRRHAQPLGWRIGAEALPEGDSTCFDPMRR